MCDEAKLETWARQTINRRRFGALTAIGATGVLGACTSMSSTGGDAADAAGGVSGRRVSVPLADGTNDAYFTHPVKGQHPAVILWPDIASLRPAFIQMADRLAGQG